MSESQRLSFGERINREIERNIQEIVNESVIGQRNRFTLNSDQQRVVFPSDLSANTPHIQFLFKTYNRRSIRERPFFTDNGSIRIPMPRELGESLSVNYDQSNLGVAIGSALEGLSSNDPQSIGGALMGAVSRATTGGALAGVAGGIASAVLSGLVGRNAMNALSYAFGATMNQFQVILFRSPNFKRHRFSWRLIPKNEAESLQIRRLLQVFKYHTLPGLSQTALFFTYPEIVEVRLIPNLFEFKPCVIDNVSINYAPNGPAFYKNYEPAAVDFSVSLQEIEVWTKNDYMREIQNRLPIQTP